MPEMMVWPDSWSVLTRNEGSSFARRCSARPIFSWSDLVFGSTATEITGSGNSIFSSVMMLSGSHSVSPVVTSFRPTAAAMSPARTSLISSRSAACICSRRPMRSFFERAGTNTWSPELSTPEYTRKNVRLPTNGSFRILNASAENLASSEARRVSSLPYSSMPLTAGTSFGDGMYSMTASSIAWTPLFLNAEPHSMMQISTRIERSRRPALISSTDSSPVSRYLCISVVVGFGRGLDQLLAPFVAQLDHVRGHFAVLELHALGAVVPVDRLHLDEVDDALELVLGADRQLQHDGVAAQPGLDLLDAAQEVGAGAVHLVDEREARHRVLVHLAPDRLGLRLHAGDRAEHGAGAVEHLQAALDFDGEVDVSRGVDDVEAVLGELVVHPLPERRGRSRGDRDAALLLLLHVVHDGGAVVHFADLVRNAGVEKDALGRRRLAGVDVRGDTDVPVALDRGMCVARWIFLGRSSVRRVGRYQR